jgi:hypothetical protein
VSQLTGPIPDRIAGQGRTEDRQDAVLDTAWLIRGGAVPRHAQDPLLRLDAGTPVPATPVEPTLVMLSEHVPATARTAAAAIGAGGRVYCLAPADWSSEQAPDWLRGVASTSVLIRRVRQPPAAAVLSGTHGWIWAGPDGPGEWRLDLDADQTQAMRLAFLELFWNRSDDEAWPEGGRMQWRDRGDPPFDLPAALIQDAVRLDLEAGPPPEPTSDGVLYSADGQLPAHVPRQLWIPPSGSAPEHARLAGAVRRQSTVVWADLGLPTCTTGGRAILRPSTGRWTLTVRLTPEQEATLARILAQPPAAEFGIDVGLGAAARLVGDEGRVWRSGQDQPEQIIEQQTVDAGEIPATSLRDLASLAPSAWPAPSPLARSVRYTWQVAAPRPPAGTKDDPLVSRWHAVDEEFSGRLTAALGKLATAQEQTDVLGREFPALKRAATAFGRSVHELQKDLRGSQDAPPSALGPDGARDLQARLTELEGKVAALAADIAAEVTKGRAEVDRKRQEKEHAAAQAKARTELAAYTEERAEKDKRLAELEATLGELAANADDKPEKELKAAQGKARGEQNKLTDQIRALDRRIKETTTVTEQPFTYHPRAAAASGKRGRPFAPTASEPVRIAVPDQALPAVGRLLRAGQERMLAISRWADLEQGEAEAARLDARLVTSGEDE